MGVPTRPIVVAYRAGGWTGPPSVRAAGIEFDVVHCPSALAVREALATRAESSRSLVLLTDRSDADLGDDVRARLEHRRVLTADDWSAVLGLFHASTLDPRLLRETWMPAALLESAPTGGYPAVPADHLDAETAWRCVLEARLGLSSDVSTVEGLLRWTLDPERVARFAAQPEPLREGFDAWIAARAGAAAQAIVQCVRAGRGSSALPLGLVVGLLATGERSSDPRLAKALGKLEAAYGIGSIESTAAARWSDAAEGLVQQHFASGGRTAVQGWLDAAESILVEVGAPDEARGSSWLPRGEAMRMDAFGRALSKALGGERVESSAELEAAGQAVLSHRLARGGGTSDSHAQMALRLVRWLAEVDEDTDAQANLETEVERYAEDGAFVDWARRALVEPGRSLVLRESYNLLRAQVDAVRERQNERFGRLLATWAESAAPIGALLPIERVLADVVAPAAAVAPVLLVVLDGMSSDVFRELLADLSRAGWVELVRATEGRPRRVLAAFPTVTEVSRASLLAGRLLRGDKSVEQAEFPANPVLAQLRSKTKPRLFHKEHLEGAQGTGLSYEVQSCIADPKQHVVGVVVNTVDDWLLKGDQLRPVWDAHQIQPLESLLGAARDARRIVVLTSDHGHVTERGSAFRPDPTAGERYRVPGPLAGQGEVLIRGPRVLGVPGGAIVAPWSERLCYGVKRNGYHGGVALQEAVVPLAVLSSASQAPEGWSERPSSRPAWWEAGPVEVVVPVPGATPAPKVPVPAQSELFPVEEAPKPSATGSVAWIDALLVSDTWQSQTKLYARSAPAPDMVRRMLVALAERGGTMTRVALANRLGMPLPRFNGWVVTARRVLNVDGYDALQLDDVSESVVLNEALLKGQFGVA